MAEPRPLPAESRVALVKDASRTLHQRLVSRDERALGELVELATPWLLGVAYSMLSDRDEAEEVVQEAFTIVWQRVDLYDSEAGGFMAWLLRITRNRALDRLRQRRRQFRKVERIQTLGGGSDPWTTPVEPDEAAHPGWQVHETVHAALRSLPDEQRAVVRLAYFEGLTQSEIAEKLKIPLGTVKTRLRLAFDKLRSGLDSLRDWVV